MRRATDRAGRSRAAAAAGGAVLVSAAALVAYLHSGSPGSLPSFREARAAHAVSEGVILDRRGGVLHEMRVDPLARRLDWVPLDAVSPCLVAAVLGSEDRRFRSHGGVDWIAVVSSLAGNAARGSARGASTITMQVVPFLDAGLARGRSRRTVFRKLAQMRAAVALERTWSKDEILEAYLNLVSFRGELSGLSAASWGLFGKSPSGLDGPESLLLAALIRSPNAAPKDVAARALRLAERIRTVVLPPEIEALARGALPGPAGIRPREYACPHVARILLRGKEGRVRSTLDGDLQRFAAAALASRLASLADRRVGDGAVLAVENRTGDVLAYVANAGRASSAPYVDGIRARRQAGSTLKPFLYGLALERRILTAASLLDDLPLEVPTPAGPYVPKNYDREFRGPVSVRASLAGSLNVPAVRAAGLVGVEAFAERLRRLGFALDGDAGDFGPSLALGSADVSLFELVNAYRTLAEGGRFTPLRLVPGGNPKVRRVAGREAAFIVSDILADRGARGITFGLENPLATRYWAAVKTGTSKDMRDNWCIGYTTRYTVGVWVGNFRGEPMRDVTGITGAAPVWLDVMDFLNRGLPGEEPRAPAGIVSRQVAFEGGIEKARREWFLAGTERETVAVRPAATAARIRYPVPGEIIAIDPDIPEENQYVRFEADGETAGLGWSLDEAALAPASAPAAWAPRPGNHVLALVDGRGKAVDSVSFSVRGAHAR